MIEKNIFLLWLQGWDKATWLNKQIAESWEINNPDWKIHYIDFNNLKNYVDDIEYIYDENKNITFQAKSDIIRLALLNKHGGIWADATMLCMQPLNNWVYDSVEPAGIWMYHGHGAGLCKELGPASWFIVSKSNNYMMREWKKACDSFWKNRNNNTVYNYFWMDYLFKDLLETDPFFKSTWLKVPYLYCELDGQSHTLLHHGMEKQTPHIKQMFLECPPYALKFWKSWNDIFPDVTTEECKNSNGYYAIQLSKRRKRSDDGKTMLFSIIIPTHKRFEKLQRAVQSVISQSYNNKQIIVVSDCYDEETAKICSMLRKDDLFIMKRDAKGPWESRNIGLENSKGDVVMFLDDDDSYHVDYLEKIHQEMTKVSYENEILYCNHDIIFDDDHEKREVRDISNIPFKFMFVKNFINLIAIAFPIHTIKDKRFDTDIIYEDWEFILQASKGNKIRYVPICSGIKYEYTNDSLCRNYSTEENLIKSYRKIYLKYDQVCDEIRSLRKKLFPNYDQQVNIINIQKQPLNAYVKYNLDGINSVNGVLKCVFVCWFGGYNNYLVKMSENRARAFQSLVTNINVPVVFINHENYKSFEVPGYPFHKAFLYLSATHKSDYMRVYMLYHYGGGYHDIKYRNTGWEQEWEKDDWTLNENIWMYGRTELHPDWVGFKPGEPDIRKYHKSLITTMCIISKKKTPFLKELYEKVHQLFDEKLDKLVKYPGYESGYYGDRPHDPVPENSYPFQWSETNAHIHHALMLKYKDHIKHGLPDVDSTKWYR